MSTFQHVINQFCYQINNANLLSTQPSYRLVLDLDWSIGEALIDWFAAQPIFPKFYWQSRDKEEEVVALGEIQRFMQPNDAQDTLMLGQRIWGGCAFDSSVKNQQQTNAPFFFLPQIEIIRRHHTWQMVVNLPKNNDFLPLLSTLDILTETCVPLPDLNCHIQQQDYVPDKQGWATLVNRALESIKKGDFEKVVLARQTTLIVENLLSAAQLLKASRQVNHDSFHFMMAIDHDQAFIGSTPERLYQREEKQLVTEALAGTIGRGKTQVEDKQLAQWLLSDRKNRHENWLVGKDLVDRLREWSDSVSMSESAELVTFRKVQHLKRRITATLSDNNYDHQLLDSLQPTAAIGGFPRKEALNFIINNEPFLRGWYSGAVGFMSHERSEFCVGIRSAFVKGNAVELCAGAGIVVGSEANGEWEELNRKTSTLSSLLMAPFSQSKKE